MTRYYCHKCRRPCNVTTTAGGEVRCTSCADAFVEEIQSASSEGIPTTGPPFGSAVPVNENPFGMFPGSPFSRIFSHFGGLVGGAGSSNVHTPRSQYNRNFQSSGGPPRSMDSSVNSQASGSRLTQNQRVGTEDDDPMAIFIQSVFAGLGRNILSYEPNNAQRDANTNAPNPAVRLTQGSTPTQFSFVQIIRSPDQEGSATVIGPNLQDYAWGPNGLDNILTALLNQFGEEEPNRSLRPEDIKRLPITKVTQEHVDKGTQCTTCMETFVLSEDVAQLDCKHIFHKDCIEPWLQRKNTCPICRTIIDPSNWGPRIADVDELD